MKAKILVVDDEAPIRQVLKELLEYENFEIFEATNGVECLQLLNEQTFNTVLLDIKMQKMDGLDSLIVIKEKWPNIPVIMISGHGEIEEAIWAIKQGAFDFFHKPFDIRKLIESIKKAIEVNWEKIKPITFADSPFQANKLEKEYAVTIKTPTEFKLPFQQYLIYFKFYTKSIKGVDTYFLLEEKEEEITIHFEDNINKENVKTWLNEFLELPKKTFLEIEKLESIDMSDNERRVILYELEKQIKIYQENINWIKVKTSFSSSESSKNLPNIATIEKSKQTKVPTQKDRIRMKNLIGEGQTIAVVRELIEIMQLLNPETTNHLLILKSELTQLIKDSGIGRISPDYEQLKRNSIHSRILFIIDNLEDTSSRTIKNSSSFNAPI